MIDRFAYRFTLEETTLANSTHSYNPDDRNASILININGELVPRERAVISVFDSGFILGDGVWEGLRVHGGAIPFLGRHLKRLWEGAAALDMDLGLSQEELAQRLFETLTANDMTDHVHIEAHGHSGDQINALSGSEGHHWTAHHCHYPGIQGARSQPER